MRKRITLLAIPLVISLCPLNEGAAQDHVKLAQSGMQFLSVVSDARAAALGGAVTTMRMQSASLFFNPATMAESQGVFDFSASYNQWIADIKHTTGSISYRPMDGDIGVFGLSLQTVDYGEILGTSVANNAIGYVDDGLVKASGFAVGFGYAKAISDAFSVGGQVRWISHDLGESSVPNSSGGMDKQNSIATTQAYDLGTIFKPGFKSFAFGMSIRNFSKEISYRSGSTQFELPITFTLGVSMDVMDLMNDRSFVNSFFVSVNAVHNRDYYEQYYLGGECDVLDVLKLRLGYVSNSDEMGASFGFGVHQYGLAVDYAYTPFGVFTKVQRVTIRYSL